MSVELSAVVLTRNRRESLERCLSTLFAQEFPGDQLEIIVIDDGSSDGTRQAVELLLQDHAQLRYLYQEHQGISAARNEGLKLARGGVVAFLADDYVLPADYARTIMSFFKNNPSAEVVRFKVVTSAPGFVGRAIRFYDDASFRGRLSSQAEGTMEQRFFLLRTFFKSLPPEPDKVTTRHGLEASGAAAFKRNVFSKVGLFDRRLERGEDTDLTDRLTRAGISVYYDPLLTVRHVRDQSLGRYTAARFVSGMSRGAYVRHAADFRNGSDREGAVPATRFRDLLLGLARAGYNILFRPLWRVRQAESLAAGAVSYPLMALFDIASELGFLRATVQGGENQRGAMTPRTIQGIQKPRAGAMKVIGLMHVRNEEDILAKSLDASAPLLDGIVALDNGSTDATRDILSASSRVLEILSDEGPYHEGRFTEKLVRAADKYRADWYCIFDADEFYEDPVSVRERLASLRPRFNVMLLNFRYCFECDPKKCYKMHEDWLKFYRNLGLEVLLRGIKDIKLVHSAKCAIPGPQRVAVHTRLNCLHFQCRTYEQTMRKYERYLIHDPHCDYQRVGYGHFLAAAKALKTRDFSGFKFLK